MNQFVWSESWINNSILKWKTRLSVLSDCNEFSFDQQNELNIRVHKIACQKKITEVSIKIHVSNDALVVSVCPISSNDATPKEISIFPQCSIHSFYQIETIIRDTVDIFK